jgi:hypothetical protein
MKNEPVILDAEMVEKTLVSHHLGAAFHLPNTINPAVQQEGRRASETGNQNWRHGAKIMAQFLKPTLSNVFLFVCLMGLFGLYCCSCIVNALTFATRKNRRQQGG